MWVKLEYNRDKFVIVVVDKTGERIGIVKWENRSFTREEVVIGRPRRLLVNKRPHTFLLDFHRLRTLFPHLRIQFLPDIRNLFTGNHVKFNSAFDLFN